MASAFLKDHGSTADVEGLRAELAENLSTWLRAAERYWYDDPAEPTRGWYGSGFDNWGVQTNQKYVAAAATVAAYGSDPQTRSFAAARALAALRFSLWSHRSGPGRCADGRPWGHTWISALGLERMMFSVDLLQPWLTEDDRLAVDAVLISECQWVATDFHRGSARGIVADRWNRSGDNAPESNLWSGALLWRTAARRPDHPDAETWRELARRFLINSVSVAADAVDATMVDGLPVAERHVGANFFDSYALDHHGYLNVGYMIICVSNAAMLHFDLRRRGEAAPAALHHHQGDLWQVVRRMISTDGRLLRIGGDSRVRYAYCQEYLLPSLLYAADRHRDPHAFELLVAQLDQLRAEQRANADGSFYGERLSELSATSPYYYTRVESDRACAVAMTIEQLGQTRWPEPATQSFEESAAGGWVDHDHGAVLHRAPDRFASFSWRANGLTQGLCLPPDRGDLAEWERNLAPEMITEGVPREPARTGIASSRRLVSATVEPFDGGFLTYGLVEEGADMAIAEGWSGGPAATSFIVVAALPDEQTVVGLHLVRTGDHHAGIVSAKGLHLGVPIDLPRSTHHLSTEEGDLRLRAGEADTVIGLGSWACFDDRLGVVGLFGADELVLDRSTRRRGGPQRSMYVDEVCWPRLANHRYVPPQTAVLDCGWAVLSDADATTTRRFARAHRGQRAVEPSTRRLEIDTVAGRFLLVAAVGPDPVTVPLEIEHTDVVTGRPTRRVELPPGRAALLRATTSTPGPSANAQPTTAR